MLSDPARTKRNDHAVMCASARVAMLDYPKHAWCNAISPRSVSSYSGFYAEGAIDRSIAAEVKAAISARSANDVCK